VEVLAGLLHIHRRFSEEFYVGSGVVEEYANLN